MLKVLVYKFRVRMVPTQLAAWPRRVASQVLLAAKAAGRTSSAPHRERATGAQRPGPQPVQSVSRFFLASRSRQWRSMVYSRVFPNNRCAPVLASRTALNAQPFRSRSHAGAREFFMRSCCLPKNALPVNPRANFGSLVFSTSTCAAHQLTRLWKNGTRACPPSYHTCALFVPFARQVCAKSRMVVA